MTPPDNSAEARAESLGLRIAERVRQEMTSGRQWWLDALSPAQREEYEADLRSTCVAVCEQECAEQNTRGMPGRCVALKTTHEHRAEAIRKLDRLREAFDAYHTAVGTKGARTAKSAWNNAQQVAEVHAIALLRPLIEDVETLSNALAGTGGTSAEAMRESAATVAEGLRLIAADIKAHPRPLSIDTNESWRRVEDAAADIRDQIRALPTTPAGDSSRG